MGAAVSPKGHVWSADSRSLLLDGKRVLPVMGEYHYARYNPDQWKDELLKMKAGGVNIVSSYVFWIHHEEERGVWNWEDSRDLRQFVELCKEVGLRVVVRGGPWAHGECRNGGFPDWLVKSTKTRTDDPAYLTEVAKFYQQIGEQLKGLYWKDGGPVIGFQIENEFGGPAEHLTKLKKLAVDAGIDVPFYTRTGWPGTSTKSPEGEMLPMYGGYPDGFWDRSLDEAPAGYRKNFIPTLVRNDGHILQDNLHKPLSKSDEEEAAAYPYLCCEIGGGMETSYHRRIAVRPADVLALAMTKIASGNNLQGYYMYHGGWNPEGKLSYLNETQATGYWNDVPVKSYDFNAPIGESGQIRDHYRTLRRLHLFLNDFGSTLAGMPATMPDVTPKTVDDASVLPWSVRSDGHSGFVFVNNYMRLHERPVVKGVQFKLKLKNGSLTVPSKPMEVPANSSFFMPFNMDLDGAKLTYATAQPICVLREPNHSTFFFFAPCGSSEFCFEDKTYRDIKGRLDLKSVNGRKVTIVLLTDNQSRHLVKGFVAGKERVAISNDDAVFDGDEIRLLANPAYSDVGLSVYPAPKSMVINDVPVKGTPIAGGASYQIPSRVVISFKAEARQTAEAGPPREIHMGSEGVAEQPSDADFATAAVWKLKTHEDVMPGSGYLSITYFGDVARLYSGGKLIADNFFNGDRFEVDVSRLQDPLELKILPLRSDAPIYLPTAGDPAVADNRERATLVSANILLRTGERCELKD
jgi:hypothetical protein